MNKGRCYYDAIANEIACRYVISIYPIKINNKHKIIKHRKLSKRVLKKFERDIIELNTASVQPHKRELSSHWLIDMKTLNAMALV